MDIAFDLSSVLHGVVGGLLIGFSAVVLLVFNGRIAGISGILSGLVFDRGTGERAWRLLFLMGLMAGAAIASHMAVSEPALSTQKWSVLAGAGLLVGFGTRLGSGCTSGHGICGLARFSKRSFAAVMTFMAFGFLTVLVMRHGVML